MNIIITIILPIGLQLQLLTTIATRIVQEKFSWKKKKKEKTIITTIIFIIVFPQYYSSYVCKTTFVSRQTNNIQTCHQTTPSSPKRHHCRSHVNEIYYYYYYYYYYSYSLTVHYIKKQNVHTVVYLLKLLDWDHLKLTHQASLILIFEKKKRNRKMKKLTLLNYYQAIPITNLSLQRTDC